MQARDHSWKKNRLPVITGLILLALWQMLAVIIHTPHILPGPFSVIKRLWELKKILFITHLPVTFTAVITGFLLAIAIGTSLAVLMDISPKLEAMFYPVLVVTQTVPIMCIAPLFVLWFGYTLQARLISIVLSTFFTITINTFDGFRRIRKENVELLQTYGAGKWNLFWRLKVPTALPDFLTSLKITFPWAVIGAAIAEWLGATEGLGYYSKLMITRMDGPAVFATVLILTLIAIIGVAVIKWIDRKFILWRSEL